MSKSNLKVWPVRLPQSQLRVIRFLESKNNLNLRDLSGAERLDVAGTLNFLHNTSRISILEISKRLGRSQFFLWSLCRNLAIPTRSVSEANQLSATLRSKHVKVPFLGSMIEKMYLEGFAHGDLDVRRASSTAIVASSTSTHPSFASLFETLFRRYAQLTVTQSSTSDADTAGNSP